MGSLYYGCVFSLVEMFILFLSAYFWQITTTTLYIMNTYLQRAYDNYASTNVTVTILLTE